MITALITPSEQWGPIAGRKVKGKHIIYQPGDKMEYPVDKAEKLLKSGKAVSYVPPKEEKEKEGKKKKKGRKKDADS